MCTSVGMLVAALSHLQGGEGSGDFWTGEGEDRSQGGLEGAGLGGGTGACQI